MFVIVVPYLSYVPIENYFITFKSPEKAMEYEEWIDAQKRDRRYYRW